MLFRSSKKKSVDSKACSLSQKTFDAEECGIASSVTLAESLRDKDVASISLVPLSVSMSLVAECPPAKSLQEFVQREAARTDADTVVVFAVRRAG